MEEILLYGAGGHAKVVADCIENGGEYRIAGIVDDNPASGTLLGYPVWESSEVEQQPVRKVIITIGRNESRKKVAETLPCDFVTAIHPAAVVSRHATIGKGSQVLAGAVVNAAAVVGAHCIINTGAVIEHDCHIGDFVHISPNASLGGMVTVGKESHIGIGACVIQNIKIGSNVIIGAGAAVINDIPDNCTAVGVPARIIKSRSS